MLTAYSCGEGVGPGFFHIERHRIGQLGLEPIGGDFGRAQIEAVRFGRLEVEPESCELTHDRTAKRSRCAHQVKEQTIHGGKGSIQPPSQNTNGPSS